MENPLKTDQLRLIGPSDDQYLFISYIYKLFRDTEPPPHDPEMDKWLIVPYLLNVLHLFAYYNIKSHLSGALKNGCPIIYALSGESPLTLALTRDLKECSEELIMASVLRGKVNPNILLAV